MQDLTQANIAALGARLARGTEETFEEFDHLCSKAIRLWLAAGKALERLEEQEELMQKARERFEVTIGDIKFPDSYPASLDTFLRSALPTRDAADRLPIFKKFLNHRYIIDKALADGVLPDKIPDASPKEILKTLSDIRRTLFDEELFYSEMIAFRSWFYHYSMARRSEAGKKAAAARRKTKKPK